MSDDELERLFGELCAGARGSGSTQRAPADVYLIDEPPTLVLELAVPGLDLQSLRVSLDENRLSVEGRRGREPGTATCLPAWRDRLGALSASAQHWSSG